MWFRVRQGASLGGDSGPRVADPPSGAAPLCLLKGGWAAVHCSSHAAVLSGFSQWLYPHTHFNSWGSTRVWSRWHFSIDDWLSDSVQVRNTSLPTFTRSLGFLGKPHWFRQYSKSSSSIQQRHLQAAFDIHVATCISDAVFVADIPHGAPDTKYSNGVWSQFPE